MANIPTSIRLTEPGRTKLSAFLDANPTLGAPTVINFAVELLMDQIDAGAHIVHTKQGMKLAQQLVELPPVPSIPPHHRITGAVPPRSDTKGTKAKKEA